MPEVIGNKRAGPALRDGTVLCPQWNQGLCINGDACPKVQWVNVHTTPAPKPPARKRGGAAEGVTPKRVRRGPEPAAGRGPEPEEARPSHREPAAEASSSHCGPAAADEEFVDVLVEDEPEPVPMTPPPRAMARRRPVERPTTMFATQAGGTLILSGLPVLEQRHLYGQVALQVSARRRKPGME